MIKFFRKIRHTLLDENLAGWHVGKFSRYLLYALGEIILVVIGILIALQVNNWNQNRLSRVQEIDSLINLKAELQKNRMDLEKLDSIYTSHEMITAKGIEMLNSRFFVKDLMALDTMITTRYSTFPLTKSTYEEMLNIGNYYNIKSEKLKTEINELYLEGDRRATAFTEINKSTQDINQNTSLFIYYFILDQLRSPEADLNGIDTLWIHDVNSPGFQALYNRARAFQNMSNKMRRRLLEGHIRETGELVFYIEQYLNGKTP